MTEKEFKKMNRHELLEMLLEQEKEIERLHAELEKAEAALADRTVKVERAGSLAEAVLDLNGVYADLEKAVAQYLENLRAQAGELPEETGRNDGEDEA